MSRPLTSTIGIVFRSPECQSQHQITMKRALFSLIALTLLTTSTSNAAFSIRFADDEVIVRKGDKEYVAKATSPDELIRVGIFDGGNLDHYERPLLPEQDEGKVVKLIEVSPGTWLLPKADWAVFQKEWEKLRKSVKVEAVDFPVVQLQRPDTRFVLINGQEGHYLLEAVVGGRREGHRKDEFAYPPPVGKPFMLGTFRGLLIPIIEEGGVQYGPIPVEKK